MMDSTADLLQQLQSSEQDILMPTSSRSLQSFPEEGFHLQILASEPTVFDC